MRVMMLAMIASAGFTFHVQAQVGPKDTWNEVFESSWVEPDLAELGYTACGGGPEPDSVWLDSDHPDGGFIGHGFAVGATTSTVMPIEVLPRRHETIGVEFAGLWCQNPDSPRILVNGPGGSLMLFAVQRPSRLGIERMADGLGWILTRNEGELVPVRVVRVGDEWTIRPVSDEGHF